MFFSARHCEEILKKGEDRRVKVNFKAADSQVNSYLDTVFKDGYLEGTNI